ncbi:hypothetical protein WICMUC_000633 [Wickerhamomyces mucosus]|uniref:Biogenesis of lysosome-related organelles complex 1 subunit KXD1 n=1 Tax=Wickerhamomyces mucosus TaxID=1378264 RepID=A0A9P8PYI1_9ASCO|nr:hypothetical protein WICMUC_000633 [Wickerhamomyces mucosus]
MHTRQPSINSQTFAINEPEVIEGSISSNGENVTLNDEEEDLSTDSYQDSDIDESETMFDPVKYIHSALMNAMDVSMDWNKSMVIQAQTSGVLKNKEFELINLLDKSQNDLIEYKKNFEEGFEVVRNLVKDLKQTKKKLDLLTEQFKSRYPIEYSQSKDKILQVNLQSEINENDKSKRENKTNEDDNEDDEIYII